MINIFDTREASSTKWRTLHGPTKAITASALSGNNYYAGSFDGTMKSFMVGEDTGDEMAGTCQEIEGIGHTSKIAGMSADGNGNVWSAGWDDKACCIIGQSFT